jgi:hypothetical protein
MTPEKDFQEFSFQPSMFKPDLTGMLGDRFLQRKEAEDHGERGKDDQEKVRKLTAATPPPRMTYLNEDMVAALCSSFCGGTFGLRFKALSFSLPNNSESFC